MIYTTEYDSPVGKLFLAAKEDALIGLWIEGQKYFLGCLKEPMERRQDDPILLAALRKRPNCWCWREWTGNCFYSEEGNSIMRPEEGQQI